MEKKDGCVVFKQAIYCASSQQKCCLWRDLILFLFRYKCQCGKVSTGAKYCNGNNGNPYIIIHI